MMDDALDSLERALPDLAPCKIHKRHHYIKLVVKKGIGR